jgi:glutaredoxin 3
MLTLYQAEWCPACHRVRQVLTELGLTVTFVNVSVDHEDRAEVIKLSGQNAVPMLDDDGLVIAGSDPIIAHLRERYPPAADVEAQAAKAAYRHEKVVPLPPHEALARLRTALEEERFVVLAETDGKALSARVPDGYRLLYAAVPAAAAKAIELDATAPSAVAVPFAVYGEGEGSNVVAVDPVASVWLFGEPPLNKLQTSVRERLEKVFARL